MLSNDDVWQKEMNTYDQNTARGNEYLQPEAGMQQFYAKTSAHIG